MSDTSGPAFPIERTGQPGMTLRDYFAAKAMHSELVRNGYYKPGEAMEQSAKLAYAMADAMLEARK